MLSELAVVLAQSRDDHAAPSEVTAETIRRHQEHACVRGMVGPSGKWRLAHQTARILKTGPCGQADSRLEGNLSRQVNGRSDRGCQTVCESHDPGHGHGER